MEVKFSVQDIRLTETHFKLNTNFPFDKDESALIATSIRVGYEVKDKIVEVALYVNSDSDNQPFIFSIVYRGRFRFQKVPPREKLEKIAHINCAAIIFPYIRETIAGLTGRAGLLPFHPDMINFVAQYERIIKERKKPKVLKAKK